MKILEKEWDFSHHSTGPYKGKKLRNWAIIYGGCGVKEFNLFVKELQSTVKEDYKMNCDKPMCIQIEGKDTDSWNWINAI